MNLMHSASMCRGLNARPGSCPMLVSGTRPRPRQIFVPRAQQQQQNQDGVKSESTSSPTPHTSAPEVSSSSSPITSPEEGPDIDEYLGSVWKDVKSDLGRNLGPEEAKVLETINYDDLMGSSDKLMRKLANEQMGPILEQMGVTDDPLDFFVDLLKMATFMQLITCGTLFYATEFWGHYDTGEAFRAVSGLTLGYVLRPFFRVEQLLWPVYNWATKLIEPNTEYRVAASSQEEVQTTLNRLGILAAVAFLLPQALLHWEVSESTQLVAPLSIGMLLFDIVYMVALLLKLKLL